MFRKREVQEKWMNGGMIGEVLDPNGFQIGKDGYITKNAITQAFNIAMLFAELILLNGCHVQ